MHIIDPPNACLWAWSAGSVPAISTSSQRTANPCSCGTLIHKESTIFYPAVRAAIDDEDLMDEADMEHSDAKELIAELADMEPGDDQYDANVTVLGENIEHHVKEEQDEMFPKAKNAGLDLAALGAQMLERKLELQARSGGSDAKKARAA